MHSEQGENPPKADPIGSLASSLAESLAFPSTPPEPVEADSDAKSEIAHDDGQRDDTVLALLRAIESTGIAAHLNDPPAMDAEPSVEQERKPENDTRVPASKADVQEALPAVLPQVEPPAVIEQVDQHSSNPISDPQSSPVVLANRPDFTASRAPEIAEQHAPKTQFLLHLKRAIIRRMPQVRAAAEVLLRRTEKSLSTWLNKVLSPDRRRSARFGEPPLAAYYWTGGAPEPHKIANISYSGLYLLTNDRWYPGSRVTMTLQRTDRMYVAQTEWISVDVHIVRFGNDGVGGAFLFPEQGLNRLIASENCANKKTVARFLKQLIADARA